MPLMGPRGIHTILLVLRKGTGYGSHEVPVGVEMRYLVLATLLLLAACSDDSSDSRPDRYAEVSSNTRWRGAFDNRTVDGSGPSIVDLPDDGITSIVVQKEAELGYLKVRIVRGD